MNDDDLSPEQRREIEALVTEYMQQLERVRVDMRAASSDLHEVYPPVREDVSSDDSSETYTETFSIDVSGFVDTLRRLPDNAGTAAFIAAYNRTHADWRDRPSSEDSD
jgi:hypothetical protein